MHFDNSYIKLPHKFYSKSSAFSFSNPNLIILNNELANELGFDYINYTSEELALIFSGQKSLSGSEYISSVYAAHQFGHFVPILGDGRAILIGEVIANNSRRYDVQLKGAGPTAYSRRGDGFSALGPVLREYIVSEFMHKMQIPTTRALAAVLTGDLVYRESALPGGVFTRVASSHIRIGTFQYFAATNDLVNLKILLNYSINRHYPEILNSNHNEKEYPILFLRSVIKAQINLVASWMSLGFIHGVMNTDNMSISGETIDYGPCAFIDYFDYQKVYSFIDKNGRYSFMNQPNILNWNLARLADTLIGIIEENYNISESEAIQLLEAELSLIKDNFEKVFILKFSQKIAIDELEISFEEKKRIIFSLLDLLQSKNLDFTQSFRNLADGLSNNTINEELKDFFEVWRALLKNHNLNLNSTVTKMHSINPIYIPRNHLIEKAIARAIKSDYSFFNKLNEVLKNPFEDKKEFLLFSTPPQAGEEVVNTFCGT